MKKVIYFILFVFAGVLDSSIQAQENDGIHWKNWSELEESFNKNPKPVFLFFHADWCVYCKKMERVVFKKEEIIQKLNNDYYAVEMNVETTDTIFFDGMTFSNIQAQTQRNGVHQIPLLFASRENKPFSLPAMIILNQDFTVRTRIFEYNTSKQLLKAL
ncbi:thioredoxin family protein [Marixanthomonas sp. SCSIO 43207]|uniref:thioredoxin family protein n=1 Tax=Marixanthomonas sp. SCSIO 43207 TaxID=2779360 RepID=UPI001CA8DB93|nr:thioredoxin family protein [Marixanthomonas sp. SCSIO 43207]UAB81838.1 thioredoxin family protein [Marixanthomonas sp. SCSIO 43207]